MTAALQRDQIRCSGSLRIVTVWWREWGNGQPISRAFCCVDSRDRFNATDDRISDTPVATKCRRRSISSGVQLRLVTRGIVKISSWVAVNDGLRKINKTGRNLFHWKTGRAVPPGRWSGLCCGQVAGLAAEIRFGSGRSGRYVPGGGTCIFRTVISVNNDPFRRILSCYRQRRASIRGGVLAPVVPPRRTDRARMKH